MSRRSSSRALDWGPGGHGRPGYPEARAERRAAIQWPTSSRAFRLFSGNPSGGPWPAIQSPCHGGPLQRLAALARRVWSQWRPPGHQWRQVVTSKTAMPLNGSPAAESGDGQVTPSRGPSAGPPSGGRLDLVCSDFQLVVRRAARGPRSRAHVMAGRCSAWPPPAAGLLPRGATRASIQSQKSDRAVDWLLTALTDRRRRPTARGPKSAYPEPGEEKPGADIGHGQDVGRHLEFDVVARTTEI